MVAVGEPQVYAWTNHIALRARLIDPLAGRLRDLTDAMLARCEAALAKPG